MSVTAKPWTSEDTDELMAAARKVAAIDPAALGREFQKAADNMSKEDRIDAITAYTPTGYVARQTRMESLVEAFINILIGYWISFVANAIVLPLVGLPVSWKQNLMIGFFMTFVSVGRQYIIRRWAQDKLRSLNQRIVAKLKGAFPFR